MVAQRKRAAAQAAKEEVAASTEQQAAPATSSPEEIEIGTKEAENVEQAVENGNHDAEAQNGVNGHHDAEAQNGVNGEEEGNFNADDATEEVAVNGQANGEVAATAAAPTENGETAVKGFQHQQNDSAAVVQELSRMRVSCGPLTVEQIHKPEMVDFLKNHAGCYSIHVPRYLASEKNQEKYGMLDIECTTVESAESIKEALTGLFGEVEGVKIQNWPEDKVFYNDYEYLGMDSEVALRFKEGMLTAGYHKLRDRWVAIRYLDPTVTLEQIAEKLPNHVQMFKTTDNTRVYVRMVSKEAAQKVIKTSITINEKSYNIKSLTQHPSENRGQFGGQQGSPYFQNRQAGPRMMQNGGQRVGMGKQPYNNNAGPYFQQQQPMNHGSYGAYYNYPPQQGFYGQQGPQPGSYMQPQMANGGAAGPKRAYPNQQQNSYYGNMNKRARY